MLSITIDPTKNLIRLAISLCFLALFAACAAENSYTRTISPSSNLEVARVASPTAAASVVAVPKDARSLVTINSLAIAPVKIASAAVSKDLGNYSLSSIEDELQAAFRAATNSEVVILASVKVATKEPLSTLSIENQLALARKNNFDGLLLAEVQSFANRSGSAIGSNQGARFGIALKVFNARSGEIAWEGHYYEQDGAAPLISVTGGELKSPQFLSVETLIREGSQKLGADFAAARLKTYLVK